MVPFNPSQEAICAAPSVENDDQGRWFSIRMAHDLKEPIRNLANCARMLAEDNSSAGVSSSQLCSWLIESANRAQIMIETLSRTMVKGQEQKVPVDLNQIVADICHDYRCKIQSLEGEVNILGSLPTILAEPTGMRSIFQKLIENALKYGRPDGPRWVNISCKGNPNDGWVFSVADNGIGMSQALADRALEPFQTGPSGQASTGVGLFLVNRIVLNHGGSTSIQSALGKGTEIRFTIAPTHLERV